MTEHFSIMVPGANSKDGLLEVHAPYDQALIATVDTADTKVVEQALTAATSLYKNRDGWLPAEQRIQILDKTISLMEERREELAIEAAREGGKPLIDSNVEVARAIDGVKLCIETLRTESGREIPMGLNAASSGHLAFTRKEPIGVVVAVSAFNHPLNLIVHQSPTVLQHPAQKQQMSDTIHLANLLLVKFQQIENRRLAYLRQV